MSFYNPTSHGSSALSNKRKLILSIVVCLSLVLVLQTVESKAHHTTATAKQQTSAKADTKGQLSQEKTDKLSRHIEEHFKVSAHKADLIVAEATRNAAEHDALDPELILAVIAVESTFQDKAVSRAGARGLMQIMPKYHPEKVQEIGGVHALYDPRKNIHAGTKILNEYLAISRGNVRTALLRYNGSLGKRSGYADKVLRHYRQFKRVA